MTNDKYDYLIVGSGLYGCVWANLAKDHGQSCLMIEKRNHPFGNCYTEKIEDIIVHKYGPHIFHTSSDKIWNYVKQFAVFNNFINRPKVNYNGKIFSFPINLFTLYQLWGVQSPQEAKDKIDSVKIKIKNPQNLEDYILSELGEEIYYTFIYGYTKKQWNIEPRMLPASIIKRLPVRLTFDDNYFNDIYQGIPIGGYSNMMKNMINNTEIILDTNYLENKDYWNNKAKTIIYTGPIDNYFDYVFGKLEYRSLRFEQHILDTENHQGNAIINYSSSDIPYTRSIEHKHFDYSENKKTIITKEYPSDYHNNEPFYPIVNNTNLDIYNKYKNLIPKNTIFGGRLAEYKYYDMHQVIGSAMHRFEEYINE